VFASLFPGRVGRLILDGVVDAYDYTSGPGWIHGLVDTDKMYDVFFEGCYAAAENCTLYRDTDESYKDIRGRVDDLIQALDEAGVLGAGVTSVAYSYIGPEVTGEARRVLENVRSLQSAVAESEQAVKGPYAQQEWLRNQRAGYRRGLVSVRRVAAGNFFRLQRSAVQRFAERADDAPEQSGADRHLQVFASRNHFGEARQSDEIAKRDKTADPSIKPMTSAFDRRPVLGSTSSQISRPTRWRPSPRTSSPSTTSTRPRSACASSR
jgi:hypothetical protein